MIEALVVTFSSKEADLFLSNGAKDKGTDVKRRQEGKGERNGNLFSFEGRRGRICGC